MRKSTKRLLGGLALAAGAAGALGTLIMRKDGSRGRREKPRPHAWARPGMKVVFRAELMPGRDGSMRTFHVTKLLPSGRVLLDQVSGEHAENEFERIR